MQEKNIINIPSEPLHIACKKIIIKYIIHKETMRMHLLASYPFLFIYAFVWYSTKHICLFFRHRDIAFIASETWNPFWVQRASPPWLLFWVCWHKTMIPSIISAILWWLGFLYIALLGVGLLVIGLLRLTFWFIFTKVPGISARNHFSAIGASCLYRGHLLVTDGSNIYSKRGRYHMWDFISI